MSYPDKNILYTDELCFDVVLDFEYPVEMVKIGETRHFVCCEENIKEFTEFFNKYSDYFHTIGIEKDIFTLESLKITTIQDDIINNLRCNDHIYFDFKDNPFNFKKKYIPNGFVKKFYEKDNEWFIEINNMSKPFKNMTINVKDLKYLFVGGYKRFSLPNHYIIFNPFDSVKQMYFLRINHPDVYKKYVKDSGGKIIIKEKHKGKHTHGAASPKHHRTKK